MESIHAPAAAACECKSNSNCFLLWSHRIVSLWLLHGTCNSEFSMLLLGAVCFRSTDCLNGVLPHILSKANLVAVSKETTDKLAALVKKKDWQVRFGLSKTRLISFARCVVLVLVLCICR